MKFIVIFLFVLFPLVIFAKTYRYVDKNGVVVFTDDYESIPDEFKKGVVIIKDDNDKETKPAVKTDTKSENNPLEADKKINSEKTLGDKLSYYFNDSLTQKLLAASLLLVVFIFAGRLLKGIENRRIVTLIRLGILIVMSLLLFQSYLEKAQSQYEELKADAERLKTKAIKRGIKADEIVR
ncbi:MAG: hypothetical protein OHK0040_05400 [bacterium]